jgi:hypothetical protein
VEMALGNLPDTFSWLGGDFLSIERFVTGSVM